MYFEASLGFWDGADTMRGKGIEWNSAPYPEEGLYDRTEQPVVKKRVDDFLSNELPPAQQ